MAGYSGTPLPKKLGVKAGRRVMFINDPEGFAIAHERPGTKPVIIKSPPNFILKFARNTSGLQGFFEHVAANLPPDGIAWVAWPKKSSGLQTDLDETNQQRITSN